MPYNKSAGSNPVTAMGNFNFSAKASYSRSPVIEHTCPAANSPSILHSGSWAKNDMAAGMVNKEVSKDRLVIFRETISCNNKVYRGAVSYTHLTLPTNREGEISWVDMLLNKKQTE